VPRGARVSFFSYMVPDRLELAQLAYLRAVQLARARATPASWTRILAASKNLRAAELAPLPRGSRRPGGATVGEEQRPLRPAVPLHPAPASGARDEAVVAGDPQ
jgi:hypothetical protein